MEVTEKLMQSQEKTNSQNKRRFEVGRWKESKTNVWLFSMRLWQNTHFGKMYNVCILSSDDYKKCSNHFWHLTQCAGSCKASYILFTHTQTQTLEERQLTIYYELNFQITLHQPWFKIQMSFSGMTWSCLIPSGNRSTRFFYINALQSGTLIDLTIYCGKWKYCHACWLRWSACSAKTRRAMQELLTRLSPREDTKYHF